MTDRITHYQQRIEQQLAAHLPKSPAIATPLYDAMYYSVFNGGKRIRPLLLYATANVFDIPIEQLDAAAVAVELIHCYSLVHDDLPAMDNDDLRRGKPTCHKVYGDGMAMLAGDALQAQAFHVLAHDAHHDAECRVALLQCLVKACGAEGMAGGQAIDLAAVGKPLNLTQLETMHRLKTGALIQASVVMGALIAKVSSEDLAKLREFGALLGLAYQIQDDILDVEGTTEQLGKQQGADMARDKPTYPAVLGMVESKALLATTFEKALQLLQGYDYAQDLLAVAHYVVHRRY